MSKAEERAQAAYPAWKNGIGDEFSSHSAYYGFIEGYHQAEKDLALTWEDINRIEIIIKDVYRDYPHGIEVKQFGMEVLKRFKERKEK